MDNCIFCKIVNGDIPSELIYEDDLVVAFHDIEPQVPVHVLLIPKKHITSAQDINEENSQLVARIFEVIPKLADELDLNKGYRIVNNCKEHGGQSVDHIHFHLLAGRQLMWPPG